MIYLSKGGGGPVPIRTIRGSTPADFQSNIQISLLIFEGFFTVKSPSITLRSVSQENAFKKEQKLVAFFFFRKTIGSNNSFTLIENNFRFLK